MFRPKSIAALIFIGLSIMLTPLIAAVITAVVQVDRLAALSRDAVLQAATVTQRSRSLLESLIEMRRPLLQYQATRDEDFHTLYLRRRADFLGALRSVEGQQQTDRGQTQAAELVRREQSLFESVQSGAQDRSVEALWTDVNAAVRSLLAENDVLIDTRVSETTHRAEVLQRALLAQAASVIPGTIILAVLFFALVTRPMKAIGNAIRSLGAQEFSAPINVTGPSDMRELGELLDWLRQRIRLLEQQKIAFLRHISHELKTPLTTIRAGSELIVEGVTRHSSEAAEISRIIHTNVLQLQRLIEDLLRFSETQSVMTDLELSDCVDLASVVRCVAAAQTLAADAKGVNVATDLTPVFVRGDEDKLRIVIDNLVSNATKFTPRGGRVRISLRAAGSCAVLDVEDTGPGVDPSEAEKIFEPFQQGTVHCSAGVKGTGLGLSITKEYVEAHDGHIGVVESRVGAHFRASLPIAGPRGLRELSRARLDGVPVGM